jgi:hypothetical protein
MQGKEVVVNLFDGQVKNEPGTIIGSGVNSKGDEVYLVEMDNAPEKGDFHIGKAQVKSWQVLDLERLRRRAQGQGSRVVFS